MRISITIGVAEGRLQIRNPNQYDDDMYATAVGEVQTAISGMWDAGASLDDIERELANAIEGAVT